MFSRALFGESGWRVGDTSRTAVEPCRNAASSLLPFLPYAVRAFPGKSFVRPLWRGREDRERSQVDLLAVGGNLDFAV